MATRRPPDADSELPQAAQGVSWNDEPIAPAAGERTGPGATYAPGVTPSRDGREPATTKPAFRRSIKRERGAAPSVDEQEQEPGSEDEEKAKRRGVIETTIAEYIREAVQARENSGIEEVWQDSEDLYNGVDAVSSPAAVVKTRDQAPRTQSAGGENTRSKVVLNITKPKTDIAVARVQEMLVPHDEKPWATEPTPVPEFDLAAEDTSGAMVTLGDGTQRSAAEVAQFLKDQAAEKCTAMEDWIEDRFVEGKVYAELRAVIKDSARIGTGVVKGPVPVGRKNRKWSRDKSGNVVLQQVVTLQPDSFCVRAQDCFPDPACGENIHEGSYFVERDFLTPRALRRLGDDPTYDREALAKALAEGPQRGVKGRRDRTAKLTPGETAHDASLYEVHYVYCDVPPADLLAMGLAPADIDDTELQLTSMPAIVTMLNGRAIKAVISPNETGEFPFDFFVWDQIKGQPWGRGIPYKMSVAQKGVTAAIRATLENAGVSAGAIVALMDGLEPMDGVYEVRGRKLYRYTGDQSLVDDIRKALQVFNIPNVTTELLELVQFFLNMADQLTNLPMLLQGEQAAGTSPETLGGMKMLVQNASSPLRVIAKQYDDQLIVPHLTRYYDYGMQHGPDNIKGDLQVKAKGSTVLVQREEAREFLMSLFQVKDDPSLKINPAKYASEVARANGFNMATIQYTDDEWKQVQANQPKTPPDPRIAAVQLRNEDNDKQRMFDQQMADKDREFEQWKTETMANVEQANTLEQAKERLATAAMAHRMQRDKMQLDAATPHQGI